MHDDVRAVLNRLTEEFPPGDCEDDHPGERATPCPALASNLGIVQGIAREMEVAANAGDFALAFRLCHALRATTTLLADQIGGHMNPKEFVRTCLSEMGIPTEDMTILTIDDIWNN